MTPALRKLFWEWPTPVCDKLPIPYNCCQEWKLSIDCYLLVLYMFNLLFSLITFRLTIYSFSGITYLLTVILYKLYVVSYGPRRGEGGVSVDLAEKIIVECRKWPKKYCRI